MVNKRVPDWLNSSLWSSPGPQPSVQSPSSSPTPLNEDDNRSTRSATKSSTVTVNAVKAGGSANDGELTVERPGSMTAAPAVVRAETRHGPPRAKAEIRDPLSSSSNYHSDDENGSSASSTTTSASAAAAAAISSAEDISRQAQLCQEVNSMFWCLFVGLDLSMASKLHVILCKFVLILSGINVISLLDCLKSPQIY